MSTPIYGANLPLSGGTLTGNLTGVAATFTSTGSFAALSASGFLSGVAAGFSSTLSASGAADMGSTLDCEVFTGLCPLITLTTTTPAALTAAQVKGHLVTINQAATITLPALTSTGTMTGASLTVYSLAGNAVSVDPNTADRIILDGVALHDGDKITSASAAGDFVTLISESTDGWTVIGRSGTWTDGG